MLKEAVGTGMSIEIAKEEACKKLGVESHEAEFEILQMPAKKTLGLFGGRLAEVRAYIKKSPAEEAKKYIKSILDAMDLSSIEINIEEKDNSAVLNLEGSEVGYIIGRRGETLDSLQYLAGLVANQYKDESYYRISINMGDYRERREKTLENLGQRMANKAVKTGRVVSLEPMNPYERRIIHTAVQKVSGAQSWSEGEEANRHVVIGSDSKHRNNRRKNKSYENKRTGNEETVKHLSNKTYNTALYGKVEVEN